MDGPREPRSKSNMFPGMFGPLGLFQQNPWIDPGYLHHLEYLFRYIFLSLINLVWLLLQFCPVVNICYFLLRSFLFEIQTKLRKSFEMTILWSIFTTFVMSNIFVAALSLAKVGSSLKPDTGTHLSLQRWGLGQNLNFICTANVQISFFHHKMLRLSFQFQESRTCPTSDRRRWWRSA